MKTIDLYVDVGDQVGFGHISRSKALASYLDLKIASIVEIRSQETLTITKPKSAIVIIDTFMIDDHEVIEIAKMYQRAILIDDWTYRKIDLPNLGILDWTLGCQTLKNTSYRRTLKQAAVFEEESYAPIHLTKDSSHQNKNQCLIYLGGGIDSDAQELCKTLLNNFSFEQIILLGKFTYKSKLCKQILHIEHLSHNDFIEKLAESSLYICTGGWSLYEALDIGVDVGVVMRLGNSILDAVGAISNGLAHYVGNLENHTITVQAGFSPNTIVKSKSYDRNQDNKNKARNHLINWLGI